MTTLMKYYDKDVLKNIMAPLTLKPDRLIFFYDKGIRNKSYFCGLKSCLKRHLPLLQIEYYPVSVLNVSEIYDKTVSMIENEDTYAIDLTGGSEMMLVAGYKAGSQRGIPLYYTDLINREIIDIEDNSLVAKTIELTLEDFIEARGAEFLGNSHVEPDPKNYQNILEMCQVLFENLEQWKKTSSFLQMIVARVPPHELQISGRMEVLQKNGQKVSPNKKIMLAFQKFGFIKNLKMTKENISFSFTSLTNKQYAINFGVWLELFVFIHAKETEAFHDVKLGLMIDWNAHDGVMITGNEIDVVLSDRSLPVFISCKLRHADIASINELVIAKKRVGGWFSKGILVSFGWDKKNRTGTYKKAKELGIELLDAQDIMSKDFGDRLVRTVREHDLVSMKWTPV